jgi:hypothetical protein
MECSLCPKAPQGLVIPAYVFSSTQNPLYFKKQIRDCLRSVSAVYNQIHVSRISALRKLRADNDMDIFALDSWNAYLNLLSTSLASTSPSHKKSSAFKTVTRYYHEVCTLSKWQRLSIMTSACVSRQPQTWLDFENSEEDWDGVLLLLKGKEMEADVCFSQHFQKLSCVESMESSFAKRGGGVYKYFFRFLSLDIDLYHKIEYYRTLLWCSRMSRDRHRG